MNGKYALYTRPQDGFIDAGSGGGIGWALIDDIEHAEIKEETIINFRYYHTIKELKNGEGPHPIKTSKGWLHLNRLKTSRKNNRRTCRLFYGSNRNGKNRRCFQCIVL